MSDLGRHISARRLVPVALCAERREVYELLWRQGQPGQAEVREPVPTRLESSALRRHSQQSRALQHPAADAVHDLRNSPTELKRPDLRSTKRSLDKARLQFQRNAKSWQPVEDIAERVKKLHRRWSRRCWQCTVQP
jgi:hypothetical protein